LIRVKHLNKRIFPMMTTGCITSEYCIIMHSHAHINPKFISLQACSEHVERLAWSDNWYHNWVFRKHMEKYVYPENHIGIEQNVEFLSHRIKKYFTCWWSLTSSVCVSREAETEPWSLQGRSDGDYVPAVPPARHRSLASPTLHLDEPPGGRRGST